MKGKKRGQISVEYLILMSFITLAVIGILGTSLFYSSVIRDRIKSNQLESFAKKIISSAEQVYYHGEPSKATITAYLPQGVTGVEINNKDFIFNITKSSGKEIISYTSNVKLVGAISVNEGVKKFVISAKPDYAEIIEG